MIPVSGFPNQGSKAETDLSPIDMGVGKHHEQNEGGRTRITAPGPPPPGLKSKLGKVMDDVSDPGVGEAQGLGRYTAQQRPLLSENHRIALMRNRLERSPATHV